jgi:hypothetical protein
MIRRTSTKNGCRSITLNLQHWPANAPSLEKVCMLHCRNREVYSAVHGDRPGLKEVRPELSKPEKFRIIQIALAYASRPTFDIFNSRSIRIRRTESPPHQSKDHCSPIQCSRANNPSPRRARHITNHRASSPITPRSTTKCASDSPASGLPGAVGPAGREKRTR